MRDRLRGEKGKALSTLDHSAKGLCYKENEFLRHKKLPTLALAVLFASQLFLHCSAALTQGLRDQLPEVPLSTPAREGK